VDRDGIASAAIPDLPAYWAMPGRPGVTPESWLDTTFPWTLAGHALGAWRMRESAAAPNGLAVPVTLAPRPLVWSDTVAVRLLEGAAWDGFGAALAEARGISGVPGQTRAAFSVDQATAAWEGYGLGIERGDSLRGGRVEAATMNHGALGSLESATHHVWGISGRMKRGHHALSASYAQRGVADNLNAGVQTHAGGESGNVAYRYEGRGWSADASLARGRMHTESFGDSLAYSHREGQQNVARVELARPGPTEAGLALEWHDARVVRETPGDPAGTFDRSVNRWWGAARAATSFAGGRVNAALGGGRDDATGITAYAPSLAWSSGGRGRGMRIALERVLTPVSFDLAPGQAPFLQSTWAVGTQLLGGSTSGRRVRAELLIGRSADRALVARLPLEELWLRRGARADTSSYRFGLGSGGVEWRLSKLAIGGEGFGLWRSSGPQLDPDWGARAFAGSRFALFGGDLGVAWRAEGEWMGETESDEPAPRPVRAQALIGARVVFTLSDLTATLLMRDLADLRPPLPWVDPGTGALARGPGREFRLSFMWRLFD